MTIADDAKGLSTKFPATFGLLVPDTVSQFIGALEELPGKSDELSHDELCD